MTSDPNPTFFIGLMSGTSLDGVDGVLASFSSDGMPHRILSANHVAFPASLRTELMALQTADHNEIHREALAANQLAEHYAECVAALLQESGATAADVTAIGVHGQTVRHCPESGYTRQIHNPALLTELTGIDVVADFRNRDIAAGGQGAPLVPAFHHALFSAQDESRVVINIGGIANISILPRLSGGPVTGFDTGPGNVLMDAWIEQHNGQPYDDNGDWARSGKINPALLQTLRAEAFFTAAPPKSTGRDLFHPAWLAEKLAACPDVPSADVQATLAVFTAGTIGDAVHQYAPDAQAIYICGGGAYNGYLMTLLGLALRRRHPNIRIETTEPLGIAPNQVEALAFAWLAQRFSAREPGNLPSVTGARGLRILGALYPA